MNHNRANSRLSFAVSGTLRTSSAKSSSPDVLSALAASWSSTKRRLVEASIGSPVSSSSTLRKPLYPLTRPCQYSIADCLIFTKPCWCESRRHIGNNERAKKDVFIYVTKYGFEYELSAKMYWFR